MTKIKFEEFLKRAREKFGDKFTYVEESYNGMTKPMTIICPIHGKFQKKPKKHLEMLCGCEKCGYEKTKEKKIIPFNTFKLQAIKKFGDKFTYVEETYKGTDTPMTIICPIHGEFNMKPYSHLNSVTGCLSCGHTKQKTDFIDFLKKAREKFGNKYKYIEQTYQGMYKTMTIICPIHGEIKMTPYHHLNSVTGCLSCGRFQKSEEQKMTFNEFISKSNEKFNNKYKFLENTWTLYNNSVTMICPKHGEIKVLPYKHLYSKVGCKYCGFDLLKEQHLKKFEMFVADAREIHGEKYEYVEDTYVDSIHNIKIICPIHGEFWQTPSNHLQGHGCPSCNQSKLENEIMQFLKDNNIEFIPQHGFEWLKYKNSLHLDFYLPKYNIAIECQGGQHFKSVKWFGGEDGFNEIVKRDNIKKALCESNGIKILYYSNLGIEYPYEVFENKQLLLETILKN